MKIDKESLRKIEEIVSYLFPGAKTYIIKKRIVKGCSKYNDFFVAVDIGKKLPSFRIGVASDLLDKAIPKYKIGIIDLYRLDINSKRELQNVTSRLWPRWIRWIFWWRV